MMTRRGLLSVLIAAGTIATVSIPSVGVAAVTIQLSTAPPAPRIEVVPGPRRGYVWAPGYWNWRGNRHVWVKGNWVRERRGYVYRPHTWVERDGRWELNRGRWDRDGDGVPNNRDRYPNNPRRQ